MVRALQTGGKLGINEPMPGRGRVCLQLSSGVALITSPPPGSKVAAAKQFGVDLTLLVRRLELTPTERLLKLTAAQASFEGLRAAKKISV